MCNNDLSREQFIKALQDYHLELERISPEADYEELFFQVFGFGTNDVDQLKNTDFSGFYRATAIINGMRLSLENTRNLANASNEMESVKMRDKRGRSMLNKISKFLPSVFQSKKRN